MNRRTGAAALTALAIFPFTACSNALTTTDGLSYQIDQSLSALVIDARAGSIAIEVGYGPITVTEQHRYSRSKPATAHQVDGHTLRLTESGCRDDGGHCDVSSGSACRRPCRRRSMPRPARCESTASPEVPSRRDPGRIRRGPRAKQLRRNGPNRAWRDDPAVRRRAETRPSLH